MDQTQIATAPSTALAPCVHHTASIGRNVTLGPGVVLHAFAVVEDGARIGAGTVLHSFVIIGRNTIVGCDCLFHPHSTVREQCRLGDRVVLESGSTVGSDGFGFATNGGEHHKIPQAGTVVLEDDVRIGANATIDRATMGETRLRRGTRVQNLAQVGHNVELGEGCLVEFQAGIAGSTKVGAGVRVGKKAGVMGHSTVGDRASIADFSGAMKAIKAGEHIAGLPGTPVDVNTAVQEALYALPDLIHEMKDLRRRLAELESREPVSAG